MIVWSEISVAELTRALETIPKNVLHAWFKFSDGTWGRKSAFEYARGAKEGFYPVIQIQNGKFSGPDDSWWENIEQARFMWDFSWSEYGCILDNVNDGNQEPMPPPSLDWASLQPYELAGACRTIPKLIAYAWTTDLRSEPPAWVRHDVDEYGCAEAAGIVQTEEGKYKGPFYDPHDASVEYPLFDTLIEAKAAYDRYLTLNGWILNDEAIGPP